MLLKNYALFKGLYNYFNQYPFLLHGMKNQLELEFQCLAQKLNEAKEDKLSLEYRTAAATPSTFC